MADYNMPPIEADGPPPTYGGETGPMFSEDAPPPSYDSASPETFDPGEAIGQVVHDAYTDVIANGGSHADGLAAGIAAGGEAAAELGVSAEDFNEGVTDFTEAHNEALDGGASPADAMQAGMTAVDDGGADMNIGDAAGGPDHVAPEFPAPPEFPAGEGYAHPVDMPELPADMTHDWEAGPPPPDHACNNHEPGEAYGDGCAPVVHPEGVTNMDYEMGEAGTGAEGDMFGVAPTAAGGEDVPPGEEGPEMTGPPAYEGGPPTVAMPEGADAMDEGMDAGIIENDVTPEPLLDTGLAEGAVDPATDPDNPVTGGGEDGMG